MKLLKAILLGGLAAGALDIISAFTTFVPRGATEVGILQYIASGLIGQRAFTGGWETAALGLGVHFLIAITMAGAFVLASRRIPILLRTPWISGPLYGAVLYVAMTYVIVPLSAVQDWKPAEGWALVGGLMAHCLFVGLPIALIARRVSAQD